MPSYRPCRANSPAGTKTGAASTTRILTPEVALFKGGRSRGVCPSRLSRDRRRRPGQQPRRPNTKQRPTAAEASRRGAATAQTAPTAHAVYRCAGCCKGRAMRLFWPSRWPLRPRMTHSWVAVGLHRAGSRWHPSQQGLHHVTSTRAPSVRLCPDSELEEEDEGAIEAAAITGPPLALESPGATRVPAGPRGMGH